MIQAESAAQALESFEQTYVVVMPLGGANFHEATNAALLGGCCSAWWWWLLLCLVVVALLGGCCSGWWLLWLLVAAFCLVGGRPSELN